MKRARTLLVFLLGIALVAGAFWAFGREPGSIVSGPSTPEEPRESQPTPTTRLRTEVPTTRAASAAVARFVITDADSRAPVEDVRLCSAHDRKLLAKSAKDGTAEVRGHGLEEIVFVRPGYLLAFHAFGAPATDAVLAASRKSGVHEIALERDRYAIPFRFRFVASDGQPAEKVEFRVICLDDPPPLGGSVPKDRLPAGEPIAPRILEAWQQHTLLCMLPGLDAPLYHLGLQSASREYACDEVCELRFAALGSYELEAKSARGEVRKMAFQVAHVQDEPLLVQLTPGSFVAGTVVGADDRPVAGAVVVPQEAALAAHAQTTDAQGAFRIGPLAARQLSVEIRHPSYETRTFGPLRSGSAPARIVLQPLPTKGVQGIVRARPSLAPIAGARVALRVFSAPVGEATTGADGRFALSSAAEDVEVAIEAAGFLPYREMLAPGGAVLSFDLIPAHTAARVAAGMTALLEGRVLGADGKPRASVPVRVLPENPAPFEGIPERRVLAGNTLELTGLAQSGANGAFELEFDIPGPARLVAVEGVPGPDDGIRIVVTLGVRQSSLTLATRR